MGTIDYRALAVLDAVVSHGSFDKAAVALGITQSAVSQRIKALEDASGRLLIIRGQPAVPTGLGQRLIAHHRHVKLMEASLDIDLGHAVSMPELAIAIDDDSLATWFPDAMAALLAPPRCQLDVRLADSDSALQMVRDGTVFGCVAAASSTAQEAAAATSITPLGSLRHVCVATPGFAGHWFGDGFSNEAVQLAPAVVGQYSLLARFLAEQLNLHAPFPHHSLPVTAARRACIEDGLAYGLMPQRLAAPLLATDRLLDLAPGRTLDVPLNWHAWTLDTPFAKLLSEQIVRSARAWLT